MCGGELDVDGNSTVVTCDYCGTKQTVPTSYDEEIRSLYNRANILRMKSEFDKAEQLYEKILGKDDKQAEAYWGVLLCKYGIEYVEDPKTGKRIPTCHRTSFDAITADEYYKLALDNADSVQQGIYESEAKYIDGVQKEILAISQKEEPYDVFICYKETDENGKRTQDSVIANDIYYQLTQEGYKVFYAAITLEDKLGSAYEPIIFAALNSAKVMLSIGTKPEYFTAVWVKNEWSRYLKLMQKDHTKMLIPCYKDMDAYELPEEFAHLQAQDMGKIGFINDIVRGIKKVIVKSKLEQKSTASIANSNVANLLKRAYMYAEDGDFENANIYAEKILDIDSEFAEAYVVKLMCNLKQRKQEDLATLMTTFEDNNNNLTT
jgi:tetratricopeptide (TPR) repeat protein